MLSNIKKYIFIIPLLFILLFISLLIIYITNLRSTTTPPTPSPTPTTAYSEENLENDYKRISKKAELDSQDLAIKNKLINSLNKNTSIVYSEKDFDVDYLKSPDYFMVKIKTNDADAAKRKAQEWFKNQGLSQRGICSLPVIFYLDTSVNNYYIEKGQVFNPVPEGC